MKSQAGSIVHFELNQGVFCCENVCLTTCLTVNLEQFALLTPLVFSVKYSPGMLLNICISLHRHTSSFFVNNRRRDLFYNRYVSIHYISQCVSFFSSEWRMHDMIDDLSRLSPIQKPSLNSRPAIVCVMSPIDLSSIFS